ncbi:MAG: Asp-tRNA(Asn)/Glu-tRNA(Gln) amidotransferase subunit GatB [Anaerolineales bacterium]|nr:Asp-tRNA(Asn)/Glu-tRNA(Gln) amidotransferase subunit GatB [Anaerolineales bacterium]
MTNYEAVIGLETHIQLNTKSKIFCSCKADSWGDPPNTNICPVCTGQPGVLPVPNQGAVEKGILLAAAMNAEIRPISYFDRKNYFYPDLPKGYQISQYDMALAKGGYLDLTLSDGSTRKVTIEKLHIEEDAGKTIHKPDRRLLDFNRCGVPLVEMVTGPDLRSADEAAAYINRLRQLLRWIGVSEANMERGHLRIDANVSIREKGDHELNPKTEIKNVNSVEHVREAINAEIKRQIKEVERGEKIQSWTLDWDEDSQTLAKMRSKETEADYRYFREPDLLPIILDQEQIEEVLAQLPELPLAREKRFREEYQLSDYDASVLTGDRALSEYFEAAVRAYDQEPKTAANWMMNEVLGILNERKIDIEKFMISAEEFAEILKMTAEGTITTSTAKDLLREEDIAQQPVRAYVEEKGLAQVSDRAEISSICQEIITANPEQAAEYQSGKKSVLGWFIGQVMQKTGGKADPGVVRQILQKLLTEKK